MYHLSAARTDIQRTAMRDLAEAGRCAFCQPLAQPALATTDHWTVTANRWPYEHTEHHLLLIPTEHVSTLHGLSVPARLDLWIAVEAAERLAGPDYQLRVRSGDPARTGGTVEHLHVHVIVPAVSPPDLPGVGITRLA